jgi:hypothetical protein
MKYLLDVNALVALGLIHHEFHDRVAAWVRAAQFPPDEKILGDLSHPSARGRLKTS